MIRSSLPVLAVALLALAAPRAAGAACNALHPGRIANPHGDRIQLVTESAGASA